MSLFHYNPDDAPAFLQVRQGDARLQLQEDVVIGKGAVGRIEEIRNGSRILTILLRKTSQG
jgi:hypothetical protein